MVGKIRKEGKRKEMKEGEGDKMKKEKGGESGEGRGGTDNKGEWEYNAIGCYKTGNQVEEKKYKKTQYAKRNDNVIKRFQ